MVKDISLHNRECYKKMNNSRLKNKLIHFLTNPFVLSLIITPIIIYCFSPLFDKYKVNLIENKKISSKDEKTVYYDLDADGFSEKIRFTFSYKNKTSFIVYKDNKLIDQWTVTGNYGNIMFGDTDDNNTCEIYLFTYLDNTLLLHGIDPLKNKGINFIDKKITSLCANTNFTDFWAGPLGDYDYNNDELKEIYFYICTGFCKQPRSLFAYDITNDTLYKSPKSGAGNNKYIFYDITNDGNYEIIGCRSGAHANLPEDFPYSDHNAWLMAFNKKLEFLFPPVKIGQYSSTIQISPFNIENKTYFAVLHRYPGKLDIPSGLYLYDNKGKLLRERKLEYIEELKYSYLVSINQTKRDNLFLIHGNGLVEQLDSNLSTIRTEYIEGIINGEPVIMDIDNDSIKEFIFTGKDKQKLILTRNDFSHPAILNIPNDMKGCDYYTILKGDKSPDIFIQCLDYSYVFRYFKNPYYNIRYLIYILFFIGIYLITFLMLKYSAKLNYKLKKKLYIPEGYTIDIEINNLLTKRQKEIYNLVKLGKISKEISEILHISKDTVDTHRRNIRKKLKKLKGE